MPLTQYSDSAVFEAAVEASRQLLAAGFGYPRSWSEETVADLRRGYLAYDDPDGPAPPIVGYEHLAALGAAQRAGVFIVKGEERVRFEPSPLLYWMVARGDWSADE